MSAQAKTLFFTAGIAFFSGKLGEAQPGGGVYLALGDSYTIGESVAIPDRYPVQAVNLLQTLDKVDLPAPEVVARTGWTTKDLLNALPKTRTHPYSVVSLLIGVNNQFQGGSLAEYRDQFSALLKRSIALAGNRASHVIVLSIPDYSVTPFARGQNRSLIASQIDSFNAINRNVSVNYKVHYVDITPSSRQAAEDPSLVAGDGLHFSGKEYAIWAAMMEPFLKEILQKE
jgi:lysophospholipase L1-like esterase